MHACMCPCGLRGSGMLLQKNPVLVLEVGKLGFRLLRPDTEDPICLFPWGQVHSWAHGTGRFTFRYFDDK